MLLPGPWHIANPRYWGELSSPHPSTTAGYARLAQTAAVALVGL